MTWEGQNMNFKNLTTFVTLNSRQEAVRFFTNYFKRCNQSLYKARPLDVLMVPARPSRIGRYSYSESFRRIECCSQHYSSLAKVAYDYLRDMYDTLICYGTVVNGQYHSYSDLPVQCLLSDEATARLAKHDWEYWFRLIGVLDGDYENSDSKAIVYVAEEIAQVTHYLLVAQCIHILRRCGVKSKRQVLVEDDGCAYEWAIRYIQALEGGETNV
jgi:hypothetical protein